MLADSGGILDLRYHQIWPEEHHLRATMASCYTVVEAVPDRSGLAVKGLDLLAIVVGHDPGAIELRDCPRDLLVILSRIQLPTPVLVLPAALSTW